MRCLSVLALLMMSITARADARSGFNEICNIFSSHEYSGESVGELWFILGEKVDQQVSDIPVLQIYNALKVSDQCTRYDVFREVADEQLSSSWQCLEMQSLLNIAKPGDCDRQ